MMERALAVALSSGCAALAPVGAPALCVTSGTADARGGAFHVDGAELRAVIAGDESHAAQLTFRYLGPSRETVPLASGEVRRQIGLKLRAQDTCNVVYVMWHIEPDQGVFVSAKANPGQSTHAACGARGYVNVPGTVQPAARGGDGAWHTLAARLDGRRLRVTADDETVWEGRLPEMAFDGPAGVRSDGGRFDFKLSVPGGARPGAACGAAGRPD